ncbi:glycosyltransferase family 2 protein [Candidatus Woesearchaeota archaeon]|nr:glycosyltransferase family 2 protein [Candidatus Woesearchaeota archaeon]
MRISIVIPAYEAAETIGSVLDRIPKNFYEKTYKIIVVNDGSTDNIESVVKKLKKKYGKIILINHIKNMGYGAAQKTGFNEVLREDADIGVLLHSDGQYAPELLPKMVSPIERNEADVVLGSRILGKSALKGGMPLYKYLGNRFLTFIENMAYGMKISEFHSGYMVYSKKALLAIPFNKLSNTYHFDGEMTMMAGKKKLRIMEIPIPTRYAEEKSHLDPIKYGFDVLKIVWKNMKGGYNF